MTEAQHHQVKCNIQEDEEVRNIRRCVGFYYTDICKDMGVTSGNKGITLYIIVNAATHPLLTVVYRFSVDYDGTNDAPSELSKWWKVFTVESISAL